MITVDWDEIERLTNNKNELPEGAVTIKMIMDKFNAGETSARRKLNKLIEAGWKEGYIQQGKSKIKYVVKQESCI